jgi:hypothetical protein
LKDNLAQSFSLVEDGSNNIVVLDNAFRERDTVRSEITGVMDSRKATFDSDFDTVVG